MDLTQFTKEKEVIEKKLILNNDNVTISQIGDEIEFTLNNEKALKEFQDYLFFSMTTVIETDSEEEAQKYFEKSIADGVEGLMFKNKNSPYSPGLRSGNMAKLKETKEDIDVVILAAEHGKGKRTGFYSSFLVAVKNENYNDESDLYLQIGKVASGIKEVDEEHGLSMKKITELLEPLKIDEHDGFVWFEPKIIIQIKYQEIQKSTSYDSGYALRFPRIIMLRDDKSLDEINSVEDIEKFIS